AVGLAADPLRPGAWWRTAAVRRVAGRAGVGRGRQRAVGRCAGAAALVGRADLPGAGAFGRVAGLGAGRAGRLDRRPRAGVIWRLQLALDDLGTDAADADHPRAAARAELRATAYVDAERQPDRWRGRRHPVAHVGPDGDDWPLGDRGRPAGPDRLSCRRA